MRKPRNGWPGKGYVQTCDLNKAREVQSAKYGRVCMLQVVEDVNALMLWDIVEAGTI